MNGTFEYPKRRLELQRKWHNEKAKWNKRHFYTVEVATLLTGAAIPIVNLWVAKDPFWAGVLSAILGGVVVVAASAGKLFKFHENWLQYRTRGRRHDRKTGPLFPKLFTYLRYNADLTADGLKALALPGIEPKHGQEMDSKSASPSFEKLAEPRQRR